MTTVMPLGTSWFGGARPIWRPCSSTRAASSDCAVPSAALAAIVISRERFWRLIRTAPSPSRMSATLVIGVSCPEAVRIWIRSSLAGVSRYSGSTWTRTS